MWEVGAGICWTDSTTVDLCVGLPLSTSASIPMSRTILSRSSATLTLCLILQHYFISTCSARSCFAFDGFEYPDNQLCAGSSACCGFNATCLPNRLCHNNGDPDTTLVRGPCAVNPWNTSVCAQICLYSKLNRHAFESLIESDHSRRIR